MDKKAAWKWNQPIVLKEGKLIDLYNQLSSLWKVDSLDISIVTGDEKTITMESMEQLFAYDELGSDRIVDILLSAGVDRDLTVVFSNAATRASLELHSDSLQSSMLDETKNLLKRWAVSARPATWIFHYFKHILAAFSFLSLVIYHFVQNQGSAIYGKVLFILVSGVFALWVFSFVKKLSPTLELTWGEQQNKQKQLYRWYAIGIEVLLSAVVIYNFGVLFKLF